jgi:putative transposase
VIVLLRIVLRLLADLVGLIALSVRPRRAIEAENLVLRRQLALFKERGMKPRRIDVATRASLALLSQLCDWRSCLDYGSRQPRDRLHQGQGVRLGLPTGRFFVQ